MPQYYDHTPVVISPSQNRTCAIYAYGSSHGHSQKTDKVNNYCHLINACRRLHPLALEALPPVFIFRAFSAMRNNFVATTSPLLCTDSVSSLRAPMCNLLRSTGITPLHHYYKVIRLPALHLPSSLSTHPAYSLPWKKMQGLPSYRMFAI